MSLAPELRVHRLRDAEDHSDGDYVLVWMVAQRRTRYNFALQHAVARAAALDKPVLVFEPLRCGYDWNSRRVHRFVIDGMACNQRAFEDAGVRYLPYVEPEAGAGKGLLAALAERACCVVTDHWPFFFQRRMMHEAAQQLDVPLEAVDGVGLMPLAAVERDFTTAHSFRRYLHKHLPPHLEELPEAEPLAGVPSDAPRAVAPRAVLEGWPMASAALLRGDDDALAEVDVAAEPGPVADKPGGQREARRRLDAFLGQRLAGYHERTTDLAEPSGSGLSPWIHFGHLSTAEVFAAVTEAEGWTPAALGEPSGKREGWWGLSEGAEAFLDELVTWREVAQVYASRAEEPEALSNLQGWARQTLADHADDERPHVYTLDEFAQARTHDEVWNAAQRQLLRDGTITNYLRMYWGKKILHWSASPEDARDTLFELNNRYALDGRDPSSTMNLLWVLGLFDRAWGPERPVFGKVRFMNRSGVERKFHVERYLDRYGP